jgi:predicted GNAT family acetyltransferase
MDSDAIAIDFVPDPSRPRYVARRGGSELGEARLALVRPGVFAITHVEVIPSLRGQGLADRLVTRVVEDARAAGTGLVPRCPYAAMLFRRRPEWRDLLAGAAG